MKKKKLNKKRVVIAGLGAITIIGTIIGCYKLSPKGFEGKLKKLGVEVSDDAIYGGLDNEGFLRDFSIVSVGNYTSKMGEDTKQLLLDTDKPSGVMIETHANSYAAIYKEFDYAKELVDNYFIEYPICLNINDMYYANTSSDENIYRLVKAFVDKANANGLTVYVVGNQYCLCSLESTKSILERNGIVEETSFKQGLIMDEDINKIPNNYDLIIGSRYIYSSKNFRENGLLNSNKTFIEDFEYTVKDNDSAEDIGSEFGMTGNDILRYNNIDSFTENQKIIIPSRYHEPYVLGVDISSYQGDIDFDTLKRNGVSFALQRVGITDVRIINGREIKDYTVDTYFNHNSLGFDRVSIEQGVYYYTRANNKDEIDNEVNVLLRQVEGHNITLPLYIDIDDEKLALFDNEITRNKEIELIRYFCERVSAAGYTPGIYINKNYVHYLEEFRNVYPIWANGGYFYNVEQSINDMYITTYLENGITVFQNTKAGNSEELGIESKYVCLDYADSNFIKTKKMN